MAKRMMETAFGIGNVEAREEDEEEDKDVEVKEEEEEEEEVNGVKK